MRSFADYAIWNFVLKEMKVLVEHVFLEGVQVNKYMKNIFLVSATRSVFRTLITLLIKITITTRYHLYL